LIDVVVISYLSDWDDAVYITKPLDLFSAVLEVPVFTMAGGGISNEEGVRLGQSVRRIGIYPRLFHWMIVRTCILMQTLVFNGHHTGFMQHIATATSIKASVHVIIMPAVVAVLRVVSGKCSLSHSALSSRISLYWAQTDLHWP
jgi:hypothetical protein